MIRNRHPRLFIFFDSAPGCGPAAPSPPPPAGAPHRPPRAAYMMRLPLIACWSSSSALLIRQHSTAQSRLRACMAASSRVLRPASSFSTNLGLLLDLVHHVIEPVTLLDHIAPLLVLLPCASASSPSCRYPCRQAEDASIRISAPCCGLSFAATCRMPFASMSTQPRPAECRAGRRNAGELELPMCGCPVPSGARPAHVISTVVACPQPREHLRLLRRNRGIARDEDRVTPPSVSIPSDSG